MSTENTVPAQDELTESEYVDVVRSSIDMIESTSSTLMMIKNMAAKAQSISKDSDFIEDWLVPLLEKQNEVISKLSSLIASSHIQLSDTIDSIQESRQPHDIIQFVGDYLSQLANELSVVSPEALKDDSDTVAIPKSNFIKSISIMQAMGAALGSAGYQFAVQEVQTTETVEPATEQPKME
jgi:hypothetical protein